MRSDKASCSRQIAYMNHIGEDIRFATPSLWHMVLKIAMHIPEKGKAL